ncbi:hypothetical protein ACOZCG_25970 [Streptomyces pseudogriseolus]|uniref:hypothetical protein n=1 Tax=Streptomyces pseudogriseolus TaxID=36817 RepID=UPI003FA2E342
MTHDFGLHFTQELGNHFGSPTNSWPASAEQMTPFFAIVVNALGTDDSARWFEAAQALVIENPARPHTRQGGGV